MRGKAQLSDRFRDFDANLTTRPWIVLGMGLRKFNRLLTLKTWNGLYLVDDSCSLPTNLLDSYYSLNLKIIPVSILTMNIKDVFRLIFMAICWEMLRHLNSF